MIDEAMAERLSRYLDGDLAPREAAELEARLQYDEMLNDELEALRRIQGAVRLVADGIEPPDELDALVEPLRDGTPHAGRKARPAIRWIGMAAGVALAVIVAMEVAHREPDLSVDTLAVEPDRSPRTGDREVFQLKPLPTSPIPPEEELVGASDRLLASPLAEPKADEPEPLVVQGPLSAPPDDDETARQTTPEAPEDGRSVDRVGIGRQQPLPHDRGAALDTASSAIMPEPARAHEAKGERATTAVVLQDSEGSVVARTRLAVDRSELPAEVEIRDGVIVAVVSLAPGKELRGLSDLQGRAIGGVADGRFVIVEDPSTDAPKAP